jgi:uncharacterized protein (DUF952 family)
VTTQAPERREVGCKPGGDSIYHIAAASDIERAARSGEYVPAGFAAEGFIHCSYASQVQAVADKYFAGRRDLVVLEIDPARLSSRVVDENLVGGIELYPHVYGQLPMSAVVSIRELACDADGRFTLPCTVRA